MLPYEQMELFPRDRLEDLDAAKRRFVLAERLGREEFDRLCTAYSQAGKRDESELVAGLRGEVISAGPKYAQMGELVGAERFFAGKRASCTTNPEPLKEVMGVMLDWMVRVAREMTKPGSSTIDMMRGRLTEAAAEMLGKEIGAWDRGVARLRR